MQNTVFFVKYWTIIQLVDTVTLHFICVRWQAVNTITFYSQNYPYTESLSMYSVTAPPQRWCVVSVTVGVTLLSCLVALSDLRPSTHRHRWTEEQRINHRDIRVHLFAEPNACTEPPTSREFICTLASFLTKRPACLVPQHLTATAVLLVLR